VISTGASDDLKRASLVRAMGTWFGMCEQLGTVTYGQSMMSSFLKSSFEMDERN
jgi:ATP-dependent Zn protease